MAMIAKHNEATKTENKMIRNIERSNDRRIEQSGNRKSTNRKSRIEESGIEKESRHRKIERSKIESSALNILSGKSNKNNQNRDLEILIKSSSRNICQIEFKKD